MNGLADQEDLRLRFDVLMKTRQPELHRYWTTRDRAANLRLFRLVSEVLCAIEAGVFHPVGGGSATTARTGAGTGRGGDDFDILGIFNRLYLTDSIYHVF